MIRRRSIPESDGRPAWTPTGWGWGSWWWGRGSSGRSGPRRSWPRGGAGWLPSTTATSPRRGRSPASMGSGSRPDYADALTWDEVDAVIVATPHADHYEQVRLALEAGKHVLCEKPLTIRPEQARLLALRADELRLRLATGLNHRFYPPVRDALALVSALGDRPRRARPRRDRAHGLARVPGELAHRRRPLGRRDADGQRPARLRPDPPLPRRGVLGAGVARRPDRAAPGCESEAYALFRDHDRGIGEVRSSWTLPRGLPDDRGPGHGRARCTSRPPPGG